MDAALLVALGLLAQVRRPAARGPLPPALRLTVGRSRGPLALAAFGGPLSRGCPVGSCVRVVLCPEGVQRQRVTASARTGRGAELGRLREATEQAGPLPQAHPSALPDLR